MPVVLGSRLRRMMPVLTLLPLSVGLYASLSRSAAANVATMLILSLLFIGNRRTRRSILGITVVLVGGIAFVSASERVGLGLSSQMPTVLGTRLTGAILALSSGYSELDREAGQRPTNWRRAVSIWSESPLLGIGYKASLPLHGLVPDNNAVAALVETGILGLLALSFVLAVVLLRCVRQGRRGGGAGLAMGILWSGQIVHCAFADCFTFFGSMPMLLLLTCIWYRNSNAFNGEPQRRMYVVVGLEGFAARAVRPRWSSVVSS